LGVIIKAENDWSDAGGFQIAVHCNSHLFLHYIFIVGLSPSLCQMMQQLSIKCIPAVQTILRQRNFAYPSVPAIILQGAGEKREMLPLLIHPHSCLSCHHFETYRCQSIQLGEHGRRSRGRQGDTSPQNLE